MKSVSVIIRALNEGAHLGKLLYGLSQQDQPADEIILVDSGSTDDTVDIAKNAGCRVANIRKEEFSFGRALNIGCEAASGELLVMMSAHVYPVYDTYLRLLTEPFDKHGADICYGRQVGDHRTKFSETRVMNRWFPNQSIWDQGHPFSNNASAAVRASLWQKHGYDESLTGLEDLAFAKKALADGAKISYVAEAPIFHVHEESWATIRNRYRREAIAYKRIFASEELSRTQAVSLTAKNVLSDYYHAFRLGQLADNIVEIPKFRVSQFRGAWQGFRDPASPPTDLLKRFYYPSEIIRRGKNDRDHTLIEYPE
ncbi:glycosyltransferase family 2 protein [Rhodococcus sp. 06-1460-1B]|uniref:glycosyltransferase family 2 protein n=1 Tax=Rhodococcus sp. 06-1460-1B TaxID=2022501 RepID=UPI0020CBBB0B|nr:glycosyltransferase [Rhodococcus sp. 06-1460-1B]